MTKLGFPNAEVQKYTNASVGKNGFQISTKTLKPERRVNDIEKGARAVPAGALLLDLDRARRSGKRSPRARSIAIIASLLVISVYIALRFQWKYAVPVLIALMHDLLITAGVYSLTGREVTTSTVAALLTILGYSLYDTIIVFDRVRENVPRMPRAAFSQIVNRSMSEVLTRSLATTFCTLLPVLALLLFGGETLKDFAFALMIGIASGAYSSIFIASPVLTHWKEREPAYRARRARPGARTTAASSRPTRRPPPARPRTSSPSRASAAGAAASTAPSDRASRSRGRVPRAGRATSRTRRPARAAHPSRPRRRRSPSPSRRRSATRRPT